MIFKLGIDMTIENAITIVYYEEKETKVNAEISVGSTREYAVGEFII